MIQTTIRPATKLEDLLTSIRANDGRYMSPPDEVSKTTLPQQELKVLQHNRQRMQGSGGQGGPSGKLPIDHDLQHPKEARRLLEKFEKFSSDTGLYSLFTPLSPREAEVLLLLAQGVRLEKIGLSLQATPRDLFRHLTPVHRKLEPNGFATEAAIALLAGKEQKKKGAGC